MICKNGITNAQDKVEELKKTYLNKLKLKCPAYQNIAESFKKEFEEICDFHKTLVCC